MKKILWNITLASASTLAAYIALYIVWGAILSGVENEALKLFFVCLMTSGACGFFLLYFMKIKNSDGEKEVLSDYKESDYVSFIDDLAAGGENADFPRGHRHALLHRQCDD